MAAVAHPVAGSWGAERPGWPVHPDRGRRAHPVLVRTPGAPAGRPVATACRPSAGVYLRRRVLALVVLGIVSVLMATGVRIALAGPGGGALTTPRPAGATSGSASGQRYVVQPGDSLWSIVEAVGHHGDPRPEVDRLALQLDGTQLQPGQVLRIP